MPEWLEVELTKHLAPVEAPPSLVWRPPVPKTRWSLTLSPILAMAAVFALVLLFSAPRGRIVDKVNYFLKTRADIQLSIPATTKARLQHVRIVDSGGARIAEVTYRMDGAEATVLIARANAVRGLAWKSHGAYVISGNCVLCHANL